MKNENFKSKGNKGHSKSQTPGGNKHPFNRNNRSKEAEPTLSKDTSTGTGKGSNDVSWYAQNTQLLVDSSSFSFSTPLGGKFSLGSVYNDNVSHSVAGFMTIDTILVPGISTDASSAVNIAARNLYSFVRHANSGHSNYESPDLLLYLLAMDNIYAAHSWLTRLYGLMRFYIPTNRYLAKTLVDGLGFNFDSLSREMADLRSYINQTALKLSALSVPNTMPYMQRHMWMFNGVYMDAPNVKAQMYAFKPACFGKYVEMDEPTIWGQIQTKPFPTSSMTLVHIKDYIDDLVGALIVSEDINIMSGDIMKAYGSENCIKLEYINEDYSVLPVFNTEVLNQIHNIKLIGDSPVITNPTALITQVPATGVIIVNPQFKNSAPGNMLNILFDVSIDSPMPGDVMVASRGSVICINESYTPQPTPSATFYVDTCGSELFTVGHIWQFSDSGDGWQAYQYGVRSIWDVTMYEYFRETLAALSTFNAHPIIYLVEFDVATEDTVFTTSFGDLTNFTVMEKSDLKKMHDCAILSLLGVPAFGQAMK